MDGPQNPILSAVRESQTALVDVVRSWTDITEQLTRRSPPSAHESLRGVDNLLGEAEEERPQPGRERPEQPPAAKAEAPTGAARKQPGNQASKPDRRGFEERSFEELCERARELEIEGRSAMSKDELVAALREHAK